MADRYTTSNMVHQAVKLTEPAERNAFLQWLWEFEFQKLGLPVPDLVIFLDMAPAVSERLIAQRAQKNGQAPDIHERDKAYLYRCHEAYELLTEKYSWRRVPCSAYDAPRPVDEIHQDVYTIVNSALGLKINM